MPSWSDYQEWLKICDTGLPQNFAGYLLACSLRPFQCEPLDITIYENAKELAKCGSVGKKAFLKSELVAREGPRPKIAEWIAPNRQVSQFSDDEMHKKLEEAVKSIATSNPDHIIVATSLLEKSGSAILLAPSVKSPHSIAGKVKGEICHVHSGPEPRGDYSIHCSLSPRDCREVIEKGWGERMGLAGSLMPCEYLIIYTPRTDAELEVVKEILEAGVGFMTGGLTREGKE